MIQIFSDGGARGNPGPSACAFVIYEEDKIILESSKYLGIATNNVAEYNGVLFALEKLVDTELFVSNLTIEFFMDSELVVKQLTGVYKIKNKDLMELASRVRELIKENNLKINFVHVRREKNSLADKMVNEKLDYSSRH